MSTTKKYNILILLVFLFANQLFSQETKILLEKKGWDLEKSKTSILPFISSSRSGSFIALAIHDLNNVELGKNAEQTRYNIDNYSQYKTFIFKNNSGKLSVKKGMYSYLDNELFELSAPQKGIGYSPYKIVKTEITENKKFPSGHILVNHNGNYYVSAFNNKIYLWKYKNNTMNQVVEVKGFIRTMNSTSINNEYFYYIGGTNAVHRYDINTGSIKKYKFKKPPVNLFFTRNNKIINKLFSGISIYDMSTNKEHWIEGNFSKTTVTDDGKYIFNVTGKFYEVIDIETSKVIKKEQFTHNITNALGYKGMKSSMFPASVLNGKFVIIPSNTGVFSVFSFEQMRIIAEGYADNENDWAIVTKDGKVDGTISGLRKLEWWEVAPKYGNDEIVNRFSLESLFTTNYTPRLLAKIFNSEIEIGKNAYFNKLVKEDLEIQLQQIPFVDITKPENNSVVEQPSVTITVTTKENGDPIKEVRLYVNNKLIDNSVRGFKKVTTLNIASFSIPLVIGDNTIEARAITEKGYESEPDRITITYKAAEQQKTDMYVLAVGINSYINPKYSLNYAKNDAQAFVKAIKEKSTYIFGNIFVNELYNSDATRQGIKQAIEQIRLKSKPQDVFIFYYAGHGAMSVEQEKITPQYFIIPNDVTQMYAPATELYKTAISSKELMELLKNIQAQKQLLLLDACQSGGAVETFAMRGAAEEKAIAQLARSTGTYVIAASGTEQFATEVKDLGHGIFTYALLQSLNGDCKSVNSQITVGLLKSCVEELVPDLSAKYKGQMQFPTGFGFGQDFPIGIVK